MLEYNEDGSLKLKDTAIINVKTFSKYLSDDVMVEIVDDKKYIKPKYSKAIDPIPLFELENWEVFDKKNEPIKVVDGHMVKLSPLRITPETDIFNIMLIVYLKEKSDGNIYTTNQKRVKHLVLILKKKPDVPLAWKYTEDLLQYVSSNKELFFKWMSEDRGKNIFDKYVNFNK